MQEARELKQEKMDEKFKLANQYRGLNESESTFLAEIERERKRRDQEMRKSDFEELSAFRRFVLQLLDRLADSAELQAATQSRQAYRAVMRHGPHSAHGRQVPRQSASAKGPLLLGSFGNASLPQIPTVPTNERQRPKQMCSRLRPRVLMRADQKKR